MSNNPFAPLPDRPTPEPSAPLPLAQPPVAPQHAPIPSAAPMAPPSPQQMYGSQPGAWQLPGELIDPSRYATVGQRLGARLIDWVLIWIIYIVVAGVGLVILNLAMGGALFADAEISDSEALLFVLGLLFIAAATFASGLVYEWALTYRFGGTLGKLLVGIRVVPVHELGRLTSTNSFLRAFVPHLGYWLGNLLYLGTIIGGLFYLSPVFDSTPKRRGWHDQIAQSVVVVHSPARQQY